MNLEIAARQLEALGSPVRLKIYRALVRAGDDGLPCGTLRAKVGLAASTCSHHIRHLMKTGLIHSAPRLVDYPGYDGAAPTTRRDRP